MEITYKEFLDKVVEKLSWVTDEVDFIHPYTTKDGKYENGKNHPFAWTCGFYGGILWNMYKLTGDEKYLKLGKKASKHMQASLLDYDMLSHDEGFQFLCTSVMDYNLTGDKSVMKDALHGATILAGRFNYAGKFIRAWNDNTGVGGDIPKTGFVIIDCMMNIPLLYWASEVTRDPRFRQVANMHADTAMKNFIREDGSADHIVVFDPETGEVVDRPAGQGYASGSSWTRGQGWAVYGFAMAYHYTGNEKYLETAKKVAKYFMANIKEDYIPLDFAQPENPKLEDSSAGAIVACGLLEIMKYVSEDEKEFYKNSVDRLMDIIYSKCNFERDEQSILQMCSEMYHKEKSRHISLIYGDYYTLEALVRLNGGDVLFY